MLGRGRRRMVWLASGALATAAWAWTAGPAHGAAPSGRSAQEQEAAEPNRLIHEKSPYLLLHARNPVDWYPWGEAAFARARAEGKPIFLSIGYSTCHWCHVMERESFSDPRVAAVLNRSFVSIKVDREERPDIDSLYMAFVQATTGGGGWPMSVFLTPDLDPFFGGTYFPPEDRGSRAGFRTVLLRIAELWAQDRQDLVRSATEATAALRGTIEASPGSTEPLRAPVLDQVFAGLRDDYDPTHAGFGAGPKFPRPVVFTFLLRYFSRTDEPQALEMTLETLRAMARGGMHDQLGGGFHRYATDRAWRVPHFEKMLYDQAQLAMAYLEAFQVTHEAALAETARDVLDYVLRDLRAPSGAFFSAEDADSPVAADSTEHAEGAFYVWTSAALTETLGDTMAPVVSFHYGVEPDGNVPPAQDVQGELSGQNVLSVRRSVAETAAEFELSESAVRALLVRARARLLDARALRPRPPRDDKVLTAWNGLMISAFARAGQVLDEPRYREAATMAAEVLRSRLYTPATQRLARRYRDGDASIDAFLDDYAFLIQGLIDLYEATFEVGWLTWARSLQARQDELFWDDRRGGYYASGDADPSVLIRMRSEYDGAEPSANSIAALNLLRLWQMTGEEALKARADRTLRSFAERLRRAPAGLPQLAVALDFSLAKATQIVIAGRPGAPDTLALLRVVHERFIPHKILLLADGGPGQAELGRGLPFLEGMSPRQGRATAYICEEYVCQLPTDDPDVVARLLDALAGL